MYGFILIVILLSNIWGAYAKKCLKNDDIGWRKENIYECDDPDKPECCEVNRQFLCCEYNSYKNMREQIQLWGTVLFFCVALCVVYLYFQRDSGFSFPLTGLYPNSWFSSLKDRLFHRKKSMDFSHVVYIENDLALAPSTRQNKGLA